MNSKAESLAAAKRRILELQAQMSDRILKLAAEVEKLTAVVTEREAREFLRVSCNVASAELSTYVKFAATLKGREEMLAKARVSFPVVKALVSADTDTRTEVLERMEIGAADLHPGHRRDPQAPEGGEAHPRRGDGGAERKADGRRCPPTEFYRLG